ncbi:MAG TPA: hypothetical protein VMI56_08280 [Reyranella sp.]|nr:hypothetical protein [Reyranella sp.]
MSKGIAFVVILAAACLAGCASEEQSALLVDTPSPAMTPLEQQCSEIAATGDMYRYCLEVGPRAALTAD